MILFTYSVVENDRILPQKSHLSDFEAHFTGAQIPCSFSLSLHFFSTSTETHLGISPTVFNILRHKHDFPPELASRVASELTRLKNPEKADSILSFLRENGFSNSQLVKIVKYMPRLLAASLDGGVKPRIKIFQDLGFSADDISKIISSNPTILKLSVNDNIIPSLDLLKGLLGSNNAVARILRRSSWLMTANLGNTVVPNVEFFKSCGVPMERILIILRSFPDSFLIRPEVTRKSAEKAKEMGIDASSNMFIYSVRAIASMSNETWELKWQAFRDLGFSDRDILTMFSKAPIVFSGSMEKIKTIKELLLATGEFNLSSIVDKPLSLAFSIEKRYKPRLRILGILESRNLIEKWPSLDTIYNLSDDKFFQKFISPYRNEVGDVYISKISARSKKETKP